jgi:hypothetical protein
MTYTPVTFCCQSWIIPRVINNHTSLLYDIANFSFPFYIYGAYPHIVSLLLRVLCNVLITGKGCYWTFKMATELNVSTGTERMEAAAEKTCKHLREKFKHMRELHTQSIYEISSLSFFVSFSFCSNHSLSPHLSLWTNSA